MALRWFFSCDGKLTPGSMCLHDLPAREQDRDTRRKLKKRTARIIILRRLHRIYSQWCCLLLSWRLLNSPLGREKHNQLCRRTGWLTWKGPHITNAYYVSHGDGFIEMESSSWSFSRIFANLLMLMASIVTLKHIIPCSLLQTLAYFDQTTL